MLNLFDKELENRGLNFARYADDVVIFCRKEQSANRVMRNIVRYIETKLHLKVNVTKTHVTRPTDLKHLGYSFWKDTNDKVWKARLHNESFMRLKKTQETPMSFLGY